MGKGKVEISINGEILLNKPPKLTPRRLWEWFYDQGGSVATALEQAKGIGISEERKRFIKFMRENNIDVHVYYNYISK